MVEVVAVILRLLLLHKVLSLSERFLTVLFRGVVGLPHSLLASFAFLAASASISNVISATFSGVKLDLNIN